MLKERKKKKERENRKRKKEVQNERKQKGIKKKTLSERTMQRKE